MNESTPENLPIARENLRVSDADREKVAALLQQAAGAGRLTLTEFSDRTDQVYAAKTFGELEVITADLPEHNAARPAARQFQPQNQPVTLIQKLTAFMGDQTQVIDGPAPRQINVLSVMANARVDLRTAGFYGDRILITGTVVLGDLRILVPEGVRVQITGPNILGDSKSKLTHGGNGPMIEIQVVNVMGDVIVSDNPSARKFRRWALGR